DHARGDSYAVLAPWPPTAPQPEHFSLFGRQDEQGSWREPWFAEEAELAQRESDNLLYVALTRAKQGLIVSGDADKSAWLRRVDAAWQGLNLPADLPAADAVDAAPAMPIPARIAAPAIGQRLPVAPTNPAAASGELFHACLEHHAPLGMDPTVGGGASALQGTPRDLAALAQRLNLATELARIESAARDLLAQPHLARFFDPTQYRRAHNELTLLDAGGRVQRLDRVVEFDDAVWLLDYKTGDDSRAASEAQLIERHQPQLAGYQMLLAALYPGRPIEAALLLADGRLVHLQ
ncbi:MAG: PD-(D/E)XK nuclease family protein, partial [Thiobacillus sp.]